MPRFIDFLRTDAKWQAQYRDQSLNARKCRAVLARLIQQTESQAFDQNKLQIICTYTPLQALLAYFWASQTGMLAAVVSPRGLAKLIEGLAADVIGQLWVPKGHRLPLEHLPMSVCRIDLSFDDVTDATIPTAAANAARLVFCTSGTTGKAKRVVHSEQVLLSNAKVVSDYLHLQATDRSYCVFPLQYMYGLSTTLCSLWSDSHIMYNEFVQPDHIANDVVNHQITLLPILGEWSPALVQNWQAQGYQPKRLLLINASDRLLYQQAQALLPFASEFWNNLGQTESAPRIFAVNLSQIADLTTVSHQGIIAAGRPVHPEIRLRLSQQHDQNTGVLQYQTPFCMLGYLQDNGSLLAPAAWIDSGDLFHQGADGLWFWIGRDSHTIKVQGELISLRTVTDQLLQHQEISGVGYTTNAKGELCAFVESDTDSEGFRIELSRLLFNSLRGRRASVRIVESLPRTESGKIDYYHLNQSVAAVITQTPTHS